MEPRDDRFGSKVDQIGPKWDKSGAFSDQISVHLAPNLPPLVETCDNGLSVSKEMTVN